MAQTFTDFELIVVDDGSTDETSRTVAGLVDPRIKTFRHSLNRGAAAARNTGIANAVGKYIAFLDDDDEFLPTKIEEQVQVLDAAGDEVGMVYNWCSYVGPTGEITGSRRRVFEGNVFCEALRIHLMIGIGSTSLIRSSAISSIGCFDETLVRCEDADFICRLTKHYNVVLIPKLLSKLHWGHLRVSAPSTKLSIEWRDYIKVHLERFRIDLENRRSIRAYLWRRIARAEWDIRNYHGALRAVAVAFATEPKTAIVVWRWLLRGILGKARKITR